MASDPTLPPYVVLSREEGERLERILDHARQELQRGLREQADLEVTPANLESWGARSITIGERAWALTCIRRVVGLVVHGPHMRNGEQYRAWLQAELDRTAEGAQHAE